MIRYLSGSFMQNPSAKMKILLLVISILASSLAATKLALAGPAPPSDEDDRHSAARGVELMMDGDLDGAVTVFQQIEQKDPNSPLGYVLEADATWWRIYYISANLIDPDVFDVANMEATPYDSHFEDLDNVAIHKAEARIHLRQELARSNLYEGYAYALRGRLEGLHDRDLPTARVGKKMRSHLLRALELDPSLMDAYLGIGIYNYFVDTLPGIVKFLSLFILLPGGSRTEGLKQLQLCAEKGEVGRPEAKFYLAKDYSRGSEKQYEKSVRLFCGFSSRERVNRGAEAPRNRGTLSRRDSETAGAPRPPFPALRGRVRSRAGTRGSTRLRTSCGPNTAPCAPE